jgi:hypothetical protein
VAPSVSEEEVAVNSVVQAEEDDDPEWMHPARMFASVSSVVVDTVTPVASDGPGTAPDVGLTRLLTVANAFVRPIGLLPLAPM